MKKIILLSLLASTTMGYAQNAPIDFEPNGIGADWTWATFEAPQGEDNPTFSIVPNILIDDTNPSATVAKMDIPYASAASWGQAGCESMHGSDLGLFVVTEDNSTVHMMIYQVGFAAPVALKFATPTGGALFETIVPNSVADAWVEVEFDMSEWIGHPEGNPDQIIFFPSYGPRATGHVVYFDNVAFDESGPSAGAPLVPAPDPTISEEDVISVYSDFYSVNTVQNFNFNAFQGAGTISEIQIEGNNTGKIEGLTFYGAEWSPVNLSEYQFVHLDYWSSTSTAFNFYLIDQTANIPGGAPEEPRYSFAASGGDETIIQGDWVSVVIPLQHFLDYPSTGFNYDVNDIFQWKFDGVGTLYFDNIYFSKETVGVNDFQESGFVTFPNPTNDTWTIQSENSLIDKVEVFNILGQEVRSFIPNDNMVNIQAADLKPGLYLSRVYTSAGMNVIKLIKE